MSKKEYLSGFKMFLMALIPIAVLAILIMAIPYEIVHSTFYVTPIIFISVVSFLLFLRSKYFWVFKDNETFDKISTVFIWVIFISVIPILSIIALLIIYFDRKTIYSLLWILSLVVAFIFGIRIKKTGKLPDSQFILIWNHCSNVDDVLNPIIMGTKKWKVVFASGLKRIPFVGNFLNYIGIPVTREEAISRKEASKQAVDFLIGEKGNVLIFPEGHRLDIEKELDILCSFSPGAFVWSSRYDIQIVPVVACWTYLFQPRSGQWWFSPRTITINYLDPVKIGKDESVEKFSTRVRNLMRNKLKEEIKN
jgi:1-acyl-sn-glycerol-3-phosphate acyltransferase